MRQTCFLAVLLFLAFGVYFFRPHLSRDTQPKDTGFALGPDQKNIPLSSGRTWREKSEFWHDQILTRGPEFTYKNLKQIHRTSHFSTQHLATHLFGEELYNTEGEKGISVCDETYAFGCFHGFFSAAVRSKGEEIIAKLDAACHTGRDLGWVTACQHGLGHGILEYTGPLRLHEALKMCQKVKQENPFYGCSSGVFMENNMPLEIGPDKAALRFRDLNPNKPYFPCETITESFFRESCYYELPHWWDKVYEKNYQKIGKLCMNIKDLQEREACAIGMGNVAAPSSDYNAEDTAKKCRVLPDNYYTLCIREASQSFKTRPAARDQAPLLDKF